jgi:hypothetical protein
MNGSPTMPNQTNLFAGANMTINVNQFGHMPH